jgi:rod shape-determining protein MreD
MRRASPMVTIGFAIGTMLLSFILMMVELPESIQCFRPNFLALGLFYLCVQFPGKINLWVAWIVGLLFDSVEGFMLGNHALQLVALTGITVFIHNRVRMYSMLQNMLIVSGLVLLMALLELLLRVISSSPISHACLWFPPLLTGIAWLVFMSFMNILRNKLAL